MVDHILRALAEPRRRDILELVQRDELSAGDIAARFDVTQPAISQHLGVLAEAGLVSVRRAGTRRLYRARPEGLEALRRYLENFWDDHLQLLSDEAVAAERRANTGAAHERHQSR
jgi:DNA-binding transcriptional ArsR family regulator